MQWQGPTSDLNGASIKEMTNKFVKELTQGYEEQYKSKTKDDSRKAVGERIQSSGNLEERPMEDPDATFVPLIASTPVPRRNERQEGQKKPATNVSILYKDIKTYADVLINRCVAAR